MEQKAYTFVKNIRGSLGFDLESYNMQLPTKHFNIAHNAKSIIIPFPYALGLFITDNTLDQFNNGYFTIKDYEDLKEAAIEVGLLPDEEPKVISQDTVKNIVHEGDKGKIKQILDGNDTVAIENLVSEVNENLDTVSTGVVKLVEDARGVDLEVE